MWGQKKTDDMYDCYRIEFKYLKSLGRISGI